MVVGRYRVGVGPLWPACIYLRGHSSSNNPPQPQPPSSFLDPSVPFAKHCIKVFLCLVTNTHKHILQCWKFKNRSPFSALTLSRSVPLFLSSFLPPAYSFFLCCVILKECILCNNWEHPSFCSWPNNAMAGFIGDHYSNCSIIASTLALAKVHSLSTSRSCHGLCAAQQCVTLDQEPGGSLSLSLWPTWQHYSIPVLKRKKTFPLFSGSVFIQLVYSFFSCVLSLSLSLPVQ